MVVNYLVIQHFVKPFGACSRVNSFITAVNNIWLKLNIPRWKSNQFSWIDKQSISSSTPSKAWLTDWYNQIIVISPLDPLSMKAVKEHAENKIHIKTNYDTNVDVRRILYYVSPLMTILIISSRNNQYCKFP